MKTTSPKKKHCSFKTTLTAKVKSTMVGHYKRCRYLFIQGLKRIASWNCKDTTAAASNDRTSIDDIFRGLDEDRDALVKRLNVGQRLYPNCDTSIWLRSCTREITSPVRGTVHGEQYVRVKTTTFFCSR